MSVTVATLRNETVAANNGKAGGKAGDKAGQDQPSVGVALTPLTPELRGELDLPARTSGAVVANVAPGSPAAQAGIRQGDVIVGVGSEKVGSPGEAANAIRSAARKDHAVALRILRDGQSAFVAVDMGHGRPANDQG